MPKIFYKKSEEQMDHNYYFFTKMAISPVDFNRPLAEDLHIYIHDNKIRFPGVVSS